jgi:DNA polymerase-4
MDTKIILHIDVNSAFLSWEAVRRLERGEPTDLRGIPSAVGGDVKKRKGIILAKSTPAKGSASQRAKPSPPRSKNARHSSS